MKMDSEASNSVSSIKNTGANRMCCVVNCLNSERKNPELQFYRFPGRQHEKERKQKWIAAVRRETSDKKPWAPGKNTRICSVHFVGGEKSNDPRKEAYLPTLFPATYGKNKQRDVRRAERLEARRKNKEQRSHDTILSPQNDIESTSNTEDVFSETAEIGVQTDPDFDNVHEGNSNVLFCWTNVNEASTQTLIVINSLPKKPKTMEISSEVLVSSKIPPTESVNNSNNCYPEATLTEKQSGFMGFENVKTDGLMKQLGGIDTVFFGILLKFIVPNKDGQPAFFKTVSAENRLLIFLMKMKHGLSYAVLGCLFQVSHTTIASIFRSVLKTLVINTKTWLFWPSREAIKETMPPSFVNYPNCRAIIDCTELRCDTPPTVEQRVLMYSSYKSCFTVKVLIGISPSGAITFVSKAYGGRATDGFITNDSGFLNLVEPGDQIMADKGFPQIRSELLRRQCVLVMPPFVKDPQFTREEVTEGYSIASVRIHVERAIQRIKIFKILDHIYIELLDHIDDIVLMACILANNKEPLIKN